MSWQQAWDEQRTPWDAGQPAPALVDLVAAAEIDAARVLVTGAGAGWDVLALADPARHVVGLDVADGARRRFEQVRADQGVPADQAEVVVDDFFSWQPDQPFDMIWDYTFLCAIEPDRRPQWAGRVDQLLAVGGELVTLIFPVVDKPADDGPPYPLSPDGCRQLLAPTFEPVYLEPAARSHAGRQGQEWLGRWRRPQDPR